MAPAVVLCHGAWHIPRHYADVVTHLNSKGFTRVHVPRLPSATDTLPLPPTANLAHDTAEIRSTIQALVEEGQQVVLLMHSYGGVVGSNALDGLLWPQRQAKGLPGGVIHLIYMAAFVIPAGTSLTTPFEGEMMPWLTEDTENGIIHMNDPRHAFYEHIESDAEAQEWLDMTVLCPSSVVRDTLQCAPYERIGQGVDATYLVCSQDKELTVPVQEAMATLLGDTRTMEYCDAGHCVMLGYAETIADVVGRAYQRSRVRLEPTD
ncbi:uncharacterized protein LTR77_000418 [Saxophila tyrrhenica]|uniref:AB hydrolase-1 domain-containing protein n=1 Tax=Saxophila tyrrhenica TaxID=1690608 RepID=A0AAV9PSG2_9PEZI|nr:hypothetical protein LTR77_000418 [Saxophila tyrrhenica]